MSKEIGKATAQAVEALIKSNTELLTNVFGNLGNDIAQAIPFVDSAVALFNLGKTVKENLYAEHIFKFLSEIETLSEEQTRNYLDKYNDAQRIGENILILLDKIEVNEAAPMLGKAFMLLVKNEINKSLFDRYCHIIRNLNSFLIEVIHHIFSSNEIEFSSEYTDSIQSFGFVEQIPIQTYPGSLPLPTFKKTAFGEGFYNQIIR